MKPKISVILTLFGREVASKRALACLLRQTRPPDQIIIVDDEHGGWAEREAAKDPRIVYFPFRPNGGAYRACNLGVNAAWALCTGDYIILTCGDMLVPTFAVDRHVSAQIGDFRTTPTVYGLNEETTARLADMDYQDWVDRERFNDLPGFWQWPSLSTAPNEGVLKADGKWWASAKSWRHHVWFSGNTRAGWEYFGSPLTPSEDLGADELGMHERECRYYPGGRRPLTDCGYAIYHQFHKPGAR